MGIVRGTVVLSVVDPSLVGTRFLVVEVLTREALGGGKGGGNTLIVADHLAPSVGQTIAFVEGREATNPYHPGPAPVDAYCSLIVDQTDYRPASSPDAAGHSVS